jgi:hypothetical protein
MVAIRKCKEVLSKDLKGISLTEERHPADEIAAFGGGNRTRPRQSQRKSCKFRAK